MKVFCPKCGLELTTDVAFCSKCGTKVSETDFSEINTKLQRANKVVNCTCAECKYSGNMAFVKYKWNLFQRYGLLVIIAIILDRILPSIFPYWFNIFFGIIFINIWVFISSLPKYMECPNCGKILYQATVEKVVDNPTYVKPIKNNAIKTQTDNEKKWKTICFILVAVIILGGAYFSSKQDKRQSEEAKIETSSNIEENDFSNITTSDDEQYVEEETDSNTNGVRDEELKEAVVSVFNSMTELQNGGQDVLFDNASLWTIANNWEKLKNNPVAGQPVDCITYDDKIEFVYGNGLTLIWHYNEDIIDVVDTNSDYSDNSETDEFTDTNNNAEYYLNSQGILVDKVEEFETQTFGEYVVKYPILNDGVDEVVVYEFDTYDNIHVVLDASNVYQQTSLDEMGDYGDVQLEQVAPGRDIAYMFDGERYYIEDYTINLLTISKPINDN